MDVKKIRLFLRRKRKELGLSQKWVAQKIHTSQANISRWESGKREIPLSVVAELMHLYGVKNHFLSDCKYKMERRE